MKFRCERDVLVEALGTAGRAVAARGGCLPVLSGVRPSSWATRLTLTGSDLDLTITVAPSVTGQADGVAVFRAPSCWPTSSARSTPARSPSRSTTRPPASPPAAPSSRSASPPPTSSRSSPLPAGDAGAPCPAPSSPPRCARSCRRPHRRLPPDPHRRAAGRRGGRPAPRGHRLLPPRGPRPARALSVLGEGQSVLVPVPGPQGARAGRSGADEVTAAPRRARRRLRGRRHPRHHPAHRGRVPQLPGLIPARTRTG